MSTLIIHILTFSVQEYYSQILTSKYGPQTERVKTVYMFGASNTKVKTTFGRRVAFAKEVNALHLDLHRRRCLCISCGSDKINRYCIGNLKSQLDLAPMSYLNIFTAGTDYILFSILN